MRLEKYVERIMNMPNKIDYIVSLIVLSIFIFILIMNRFRVKKGKSKIWVDISLVGFIVTFLFNSYILFFRKEPIRIKPTISPESHVSQLVLSKEPIDCLQQFKLLINTNISFNMISQM